MKRLSLLLSLILGLLPALRAAEATPATPGREAWVMHFDGDWRIAGGLPEKALLIGLVLAHAELVSDMTGITPLLLLDEPTASLDATNRAAVVELIQAKKQSGTAVLGIFHDEDVRNQVADRIVDVTRFKLAA